MKTNNILSSVLLLLAMLTMVISACAQPTSDSNRQMMANNQQIGANMGVGNTQMIGSSQMMTGNTVNIADNSTNILDLIRADHAKLLVLAENVEILRSSNQTTAAMQNFSMLVALASAHMRAEEQVFYPALEKGKVNTKTILAGIEEHNLTRQEAAALQNMPIQSDGWGARFEVMTDVTKQHMDEEETTIFTIAEKDLTMQQLNDLGMRFKQAEGTTPT